MFSIREYNSEFLHTNPSKKNTTVCWSVVEFKANSRYIRACCNLDCWVSAGGECGGINKVKIARVCPRINNWDGNSDVLMKLFIFAYRLLIQTSWTDKYSICPNTPLQHVLSSNTLKSTTSRNAFPSTFLRPRPNLPLRYKHHAQLTSSKTTTGIKPPKSVDMGMLKPYNRFVSIPAHSSSVVQGPRYTGPFLIPLFVYKYSTPNEF